MPVTLADLDNIVNQIKKPTAQLRDKLYPYGKPDWMSQEEWDNIKEA